MDSMSCLRVLRREEVAFFSIAIPLLRELELSLHQRAYVEPTEFRHAQVVVLTTELAVVEVAARWSKFVAGLNVSHRCEELVHCPFDALVLHGDTLSVEPKLLTVFELA